MQKFFEGASELPIPAVPFALPVPPAFYFSSEKSHAGSLTSQIKKRKDRLNDYREVAGRLLHPVFRVAAAMGYIPLGKSKSMKAWQDEGVELLRLICTQGITEDSDIGTAHEEGSVDLPSLPQSIDAYQNTLNTWRSNLDRIMPGLSRSGRFFKQPTYTMALAVVAMQDHLGLPFLPYRDDHEGGGQ